MPRSLLVRLLALLCAATLGVPTVAQAPAPARPQAPTPSAAPPGGTGQNRQEPTVLRVTTRLVQVNVIVQDKKGEPVGDLTQGDFTLLDQGESQTISTFSMESTRVLPARVQPLPANFFTNRYEQKGGAPTSVTVILLDGLNTKFEDMAYARQQIVKFLGQLQPQDRVGLYTLTTRLSILHDFTSDAAPLLRALARFKGHAGTELAASEPEPADTGNNLIDDFLNAANQRMSDFYTINRARSTADALEAIANHVAGLPGRKNLIWVSGGFPFYIGLDAPMDPNNTQERRTFSEDVERAARALNNANLAVYPVDARGLMAPASYNRTFSAATPSQRLDPRRPPNIGSLHPNPANFDTMNVLAERTGGRAFYNTNDIQGAIRRSIEDSRVTYVLGYYPTHGKWDGKFRELKIQVKRPGLHLRHRRGYFALPERQLEPKQRDHLLRAAADSPLDDTSVGLSVKVQPVDVPGARTLVTEFQINQRDITLQQESGRWNGVLDVFLLQRGADGKELNVEVQTFNMHLTQQTYEAVMKQGLAVTRNIRIQPGAAQLRIVVRDSGSSEIGSLTVPLDKFFPAGS